MAAKVFRNKALTAAIVTTIWLARLVAAPGAHVHGRVLDPSGLPLPGVSVTLSSPTLGGSGASPQTVTTGRNGEFDADVNPGGWHVLAELSGFSPAANDVVVGAGGADLTLQLKLASYQEEVTVAGPAEQNVIGEARPEAPVTVT